MQFPGIPSGGAVWLLRCSTPRMSRFRSIWFWGEMQGFLLRVEALARRQRAWWRSWLTRCNRVRSWLLPLLQSSTEWTWWFGQGLRELFPLQRRVGCCTRCDFAGLKSELAVVHFLDSRTSCRFHNRLGESEVHIRFKVWVKLSSQRLSHHGVVSRKIFNDGEIPFDQVLAGLGQVWEKSFRWRCHFLLLYPTQFCWTLNEKCLLFTLQGRNHRRNWGHRSQVSRSQSKLTQPCATINRRRPTILTSRFNTIFRLRELSTSLSRFPQRFPWSWRF